MNRKNSEKCIKNMEIKFTLDYDKIIDINKLIQKLEKIDIIVSLNFTTQIYNALLKNVEINEIYILETIYEELYEICKSANGLISLYNNQIYIRIKNERTIVYVLSENSILNEMISYLKNMRQNYLYYIEIIKQFITKYEIETNKEVQKEILPNRVGMICKNSPRNQIIQLIREIIADKNNFMKIHLNLLQKNIETSCCNIQ